VQPIPKAGAQAARASAAPDDDACYDQHRCITIGSLLAKVFSMLLDARITDYLEANGLRSVYQGGFRPSRGTTEQVFVLNHLAEAARQRRAPLYCAFVDFRKAFDTVRHQHLWERLDAYGWTPTTSPAPSKPAYARCTPSRRWRST
jgi:hypothetical protein